jgi:aldose 1-epimerase
VRRVGEAGGGGAAAAGELVRIADGPIEVEVVPAAGARLHRLRFDGHDLLRTPHDLRPYLDDPYFYGSYPMAPWCNRVPVGRSLVAGRVVDLPASFPDGTAIHGQVSRRPWAVAGDGVFRIAGGGDGWPWPYEVEQRIRIDGSTLALTLRLTNRSDGPMPGGLGFHPWFRTPVDVRIGADAVHPDNLATLPEPVPVTGEHDLRRLGPMAHGLDATWADISDPPIVLSWPGPGIRATIGFTASTRFVTAANLFDDAIAVEPQTHAPDGLGRLVRGEPGGLALIPPGGTLELAVTIAFERVGDGRKPDTP